MRLCIVTHVKFYKDGQGYICTPGFEKRMQVISPLYNKVDLCVPVYSQKPPKNYARVNIPNLTVCPLIPYFDVRDISALRHPIALMRGLWPYIRRSDAVFILLPNYLSILAWLCCLIMRKKFALAIVGDRSRMIRWAFVRRGLAIFGFIASGIHRLLLLVMIRTSAVTMTCGQELAGRYGRGNPRVISYIASTFHENDIARCVASSGSEKTRILFVGRLDSGKGLKELFEAVRDLIVEGFKLQVRIVGEGSERSFLVEHIKQLGIDDHVDFTGWIAMGPALEKEYRTSDIFVLPSYSEGSPKVVIEAMANGLPVIATGVGSVPDVVRDGQSGFVVPTHDTPALRDALRKLVLDDNYENKWHRPAYPEPTNSRWRPSATA